FISHIILPTGSVGISGNSPGIITKIAISHSLNDFLDFGYNLGYNFPGHWNGDLTYSGTAGVRISEKVGVYAEIYGEVYEFNSLISNFDSGLTFLIQNNLQLDLSSGIGLNQKMSFFSIGCSWNIYKKVRAHPAFAFLRSAMAGKA
ncbi:MAG: transporter, partial [Bacteroidales bacterium]